MADTLIFFFVRVLPTPNFLFLLLILSAPTHCWKELTLMESLAGRFEGT